jgi:hypothetical protein
MDAAASSPDTPRNIEFRCACGRVSRIPPQYAGERGRCPGCHAGFVVPAEQFDTRIFLAAAANEPPNANAKKANTPSSRTVELNESDLIDESSSSQVYPPPAPLDAEWETAAGVGRPTIVKRAPLFGAQPNTTNPYGPPRAGVNFFGVVSIGTAVISTVVLAAVAVTIWLMSGGMDVVPIGMRIDERAIGLVSVIETAFRVVFFLGFFAGIAGLPERHTRRWTNWAGIALNLCGLLLASATLVNQLDDMGMGIG